LTAEKYTCIFIYHYHPYSDTTHTLKTISEFFAKQICCGLRLSGTIRKEEQT